MSERFATRQDVADRIEWEGGVAGALDYGISDDDMPDGDTALIAAWASAQDAHRVYRERERRLEEILYG